MATNTNTIKQPSKSYTFWEPTWTKARAVVEGAAAVKQFDDTLRTDGSNLLIPFSNAMSPASYSHYKQTAELPGFTASQRKTVLSALLRKQVAITLPAELNNDDVRDWISNNIYLGQGSIMSLIKDAVRDDLITSNTWLLLDYNTYTEQPVVEVLPATAVISATVGFHPKKGYGNLIRLVVRRQDQRIVDDTVEDFYRYQVHSINDEGNYQVTTYVEDGEDGVTQEGDVPVIPTRVVGGQEVSFDEILVYPMDGSPNIESAFLADFATREMALYNLLAARNHLLILSSALTPVLTGNITDKAKQSIRDRGLGAVWYLPEGADVKILETPTGALSGLNSSIENTRQDLQQLGARQLVKDSRASGTALEITNSPYSATLSSLSRTYSNTLRKVIAQAVNWQYKTDYNISEFNVELSSDLSRSATGSDAMTHALTLYDGGLITGDEVIKIAKDNSVVSSDYQQPVSAGLKQPQGNNGAEEDNSQVG